jgi:hypothetical protein
VGLGIGLAVGLAVGVVRTAVAEPPLPEHAARDAAAATATQRI